jgi:cytochrome c biogenesis protein CcmG/thiol:disulfide interchange protein DsbE
MADEPPTESPPPTLSPSRSARQVVGPFTLLHIFSLLAVLLVVGVLLSLLTTPIGPGAATPPPQPGASFYLLGDPTAGLAVGQQAPPLTGTIDGRTISLTDLDGKPIDLAALRGHPVWINFFASWCGPCQLETPVLRQVYETHKAEGLSVVAVSVQETTADDVRAYARTYDLAYTIGFDGTSAVFKAWQGFGLPTHYFLDAEGIIRATHYGPLSVLQAEQILAPLLSGTSSPAPSAAP